MLIFRKHATDPNSTFQRWYFLFTDISRCAMVRMFIARLRLQVEGTFRAVPCAEVQGLCGHVPEEDTGVRARLATHRLLPRVLCAVPAGLTGGRHADLLLLGPAAPQAPVATGGAHGDWLEGKGAASEPPATAGRGDRHRPPPGPPTTPAPCRPRSWNPDLGARRLTLFTLMLGWKARPLLSQTRADLVF